MTTVFPRRARVALVVSLAIAAFVLRIWGIQNRFWMLEDQIRDWSIALRPFWQLPLVGSPTHVHGYTIGPAFYWILWGIRVVLGPFFDNLPHAGGIGQAALQTAADTLLLVAVWRRTGSPWIAITTFVLIVTSSYELAVAAFVWNPTMGMTLSTAATALVLLNWHRRSVWRSVIVAAIAWSAVHAYTGAIFVTLSVLLALVVDAWIESGRIAAMRAMGIVAATIAVLQLPYLFHQLGQHFSDPAMGAVSGGVGEILSGRAEATWARSVAFYRDATQFNLLQPAAFGYLGWALLVGAVLTMWQFRRNPIVLIVVLLPQLGAMAGYALFLGALDFYYYLPLMPAAALTLLLPLSGIPWPRMRHGAGIAVLLVAVVTIPTRVSVADKRHRLPEYRVLVGASRTLRNLHQPLRAIVTDFPLPPSCDPDFLYRVLGGQMDRKSPWVAVISADGKIRYINNDLDAGRKGSGAS